MRIIIGISGGIAAYKIPFLIRLLKKSGAEVKCILTPSAVDFISPIVVSALSNEPVGIDFWNKETGEWNNHVAYGEWADLLVIAPATANTIAKMATGACDNLLLATYLSMRNKTLVVPAMDLDMYKHPSFLRNIEQLTKDGVTILPASEGELASGLFGQGRMEEPEIILTKIQEILKTKTPLLGKTVLITAGPTHEAIDPVRFIGNSSSGKMGFALAETAIALGAKVVLISGPTNCTLTHDALEIIHVTTADEMLAEVKAKWEACSMGIFSAAVADYKPATVSDTKIKKVDDVLHIELVKNPDIVSWASNNKKENQLTIGFALETNNEKENALEKLKKKNMNIIILNSLNEKGAGFEKDTNKITIFDSKGDTKIFDLKHKKSVAIDIFDYIIEYSK
ncbi:MAG: bifunctional phosphopantothenoylcysteine decarboxylase/phosphopantothenate--cysteine ligase CoaBC [Flavobacteriia bacterium]|nr:bifunctional phosphopantothenoylcysteine decarboxylase/phosphopantothenate--cysteine ligase CoaBC [Flavobacteriia bacterium]